MLPVNAVKTSFLKPMRGSDAAVRNFVQAHCILLSCLTLLVVLLSSSAALEESAFGAAPASASGASAAGITGANAQLNRARLIPGATLFQCAVVATHLKFRTSSESHCQNGVQRAAGCRSLPAMLR